MDKKTVFVKTDKGESEARGQSDELYGDAKRILLLVDDASSVGEISKRAAPSLRETLFDMLQQLVDSGYIRDVQAGANVSQKSTLKMASPAIKMETQKADLDFSFMPSTASQSEDAAGAVKAKKHAEAEAKASHEAEAERIKSEQSARIEAAARAVKLKAYEEAKEKAKIEVAARARLEAEVRAKNEAEAARLKAEQEALKTRRELESTQARVEAEVRARIEAEAKVKQEVEAARLKAEREAEIIRLEMEAVKAKAVEEMRKRLEAEAQAKVEAEARLKREAEADRLRLEKVRAELEAARVKAEAEVRMRVEAERRVRAEVEERVRREEEAERLRVEKERAELESARVKAETELKMRSEAEVRIRAEVEARLKAEALDQHETQRSSPQDTASGAGLDHIPSIEEQIDPAEKLRQSFVESFGQAKGKQKNGSFNFKLDTFSLDGSAQKKGTIAYPKKSKSLPGSGSKVKAAIEHRAEKEAEAARIEVEQEAARLMSEQEYAARIKSEQESIRIKAEQEVYRLKTAQEEERKKAETEAQKLSDQQAKQWEEAQRRAANQAQAEKERLARQSAEAQIKPLHKPARIPRKPLPIGKMVASIFALMLVAVAGLPYIWPLDQYIAPLEKEISAQLYQPVHIKKIHLALLPLPKLELHDLTVGSGQELKAGNVELNFDFSALFARTKSINSMELSHVVLTGSSLDKSLGWIQAAGANEKYPVTRMEFRGVQVISDEIQLPLLNGRADFDTQGKFAHADLKSEDGKFGLELNSLQNRLQLELNIHESSLPVLNNIKFNDLSVNGVVGNGEVVFSDFFAHIHGGAITGKGQLNWSNGWKLQGQLNAKSLELQSMFPKFGVTGELYGDVNVSMYGSALSQLDKDPRMEGTFEAKNGVVNKLDIDTIARFGTSQGGTGRTSFSELIGTLKADQHGQRFNLSKIAAGAVSGSGIFEVDAKQQLSGKLLVDIKGDAKGNVPLQLSGSPAAPLLQQGR